MEDNLPYQMGKTEARPDAILFGFWNYFSQPDLPTPPKVFGVWRHFWNIKMFQNNKIGNCVFAQAANETSSWFHDVGKWVEFMDDGVISDYSAVSGYVPGRRDTDKGTDMGNAAEYRRKKGIIDRYGRRHRIDAYVKLNKGNYDDLVVAMYLFGAVGIGLLMPKHTQEDFTNRRPWAIGNPNNKVVGGHYVSGCGIDENGDIVVMTWGGYQRMTRKFFEKYNDESACYFSIERMVNKVSPEGFRAEALIEDLKSLKSPFGYSGYSLEFDRITGEEIA